MKCQTWAWRWFLPLTWTWSLNFLTWPGHNFHFARHSVTKRRVGDEHHFWQRLVPFALFTRLRGWSLCCPSKVFLLIAPSYDTCYCSFVRRPYGHWNRFFVVVYQILMESSAVWVRQIKWKSWIYPRSLSTKTHLNKFKYKPCSWRITLDFLTLAHHRV